MRNKEIRIENRELQEQIKYFRERVAWQAMRGRTDGTYDHQRLAELEMALEEMQTPIDGEENVTEEYNGEQDL